MCVGGWNRTMRELIIMIENHVQHIFCMSTETYQLLKRLY